MSKKVKVKSAAVAATTTIRRRKGNSQALLDGMLSFCVTYQQRTWKRNKSGGVTQGYINGYNCFRTSANFDIGKATTKTFTYGGKRGRTREEARNLAINWRQAAMKKITQINSDLYNAWSGKATSGTFPQNYQVRGTEVRIPKEDWENYKILLIAQLNRI
ncbi:MAG: hypothetical protein H8D97_00700 [Proteobacteria bacterium]|nr:hypothetical protein [Pseudomonadota bacterium]